MDPVQHHPSYTRNQDSELNIESIISAPLIALSKANTMMLNGQTQAILDQYFLAVKKKKKRKMVYKPRMINMTLTKRVDVNGDSIEHDVIFQIPLMSIAPINSIAVEKMKVSFDLEITSITSYLNNTNGIIERKAQLHGKISNKQNDHAASKKYTKPNLKALNIAIQANTLPLPLGILNLIDLYSKNIHPLNSK